MANATFVTFVPTEANYRAESAAYPSLVADDIATVRGPVPCIVLPANLVSDADFVSVMPGFFFGGFGVNIHWFSDTADADFGVTFFARYERKENSIGANGPDNAYVTNWSSTVNQLEAITGYSAGTLRRTQITVSNTELLEPNELFRLRVGRDGLHVNDDLADAIKIVAITLESL